jgi:hypothetical protein
MDRIHDEINIIPMEEEAITSINQAGSKIPSTFSGVIKTSRKKKKTIILPSLTNSGISI